MHPILRCACLLLLGGCALAEPAAQPAQQHALQNELLHLTRQQQDLAQRLQSLEVNLAQLEVRLREQEDRLTRRAAEPAAPAAQMVTGGGEMTAPATEPGVLLPANDLYMQAFADYTAGRYREAARGFEIFLEHYTDNPYAGNAQFWLGECFFALQQYPRAIQEYQRTVERYPQGGKSPEALVKMAAALRETNQSGRAREVLQLLQQQYPDSAAAQRVRQGQ